MTRMTETERVARSGHVFSHSVRMALHQLSDLRMMFNALGIGGHEQMKAYELIESETRAIIEDIRRQMDRPRSQPATEDLQRYLDESVMRRDG